MKLRDFSSQELIPVYAVTQAFQHHLLTDKIPLRCTGCEHQEFWKSITLSEVQEPWAAAESHILLSKSVGSIWLNSLVYLDGSRKPAGRYGSNNNSTNNKTTSIRFIRKLAECFVKLTFIVLMLRSAYVNI